MKVSLLFNSLHIHKIKSFVKVNIYRSDVSKMTFIEKVIAQENIVFEGQKKILKSDGVKQNQYERKNQETSAFPKC